MQCFFWVYSESFLDAEEQLEMFTGARKDFDDSLHFYCQTIRLRLENEARDTGRVDQEGLNVQEQLRTLFATMTLPNFENVDFERYEELTSRLSSPLPSSTSLGKFQQAVTLGLVSWEGMIVVAEFEHQFILIDLANLA
ncbi:hypothetical protein SU48_09855 [Deinococcus puniceus]|uniref:Uncharacterized protein n=1 Tax=Deinococcus puniceus TaxID=1182568 RepID=A0A172TAK5_9DEIO|nr:hypothetical protein SU48_09855 [Deinococcus puniceus]